jgi:sulfite exporter TauE/SafE
MKKTVYVQWMDCVSCETVLRDALDAVPSIKVVSLTHKTWKMTIEYKSKNDLKKLQTILAEHEYTLTENAWTHWTSKNTKNRLEQFAIWAWILALFWVFMQLDLTQYIWDYGVNMWLWVAFLVWLVACGSSCLAVTWWIVVSYVEALEDKNRWSLVKTQWLFHVWRMLMFIVWGALLWSIGKTFQISPTVNAIFMMIVWAILAYVWLQIFGIVPSITKWWFHLPGGTQKLIKKLNSPKYALVVWALTFFLPCWFTQSMQLFAMQSWSAMQWALLLGAYWLGTVPLLLWLWLSAGYFKSKMALFNKVVAGLLVMFGLMTFVNWWNGSQNSLMSSVNQNEIHASAQNWENTNIERLARPHLWNRLEPKDILVNNNTNYEITINPSMNGIWCKSWINLPDWTQRRVEKWQPLTFNFNPVKPWTYKLTCNLWSSHWSIVVE